MIFELKDVIQAIAGAVTPVLERNETVIKLLQRFNLAPEHPPGDFSGVYAYALVEYGVGKPGAFLELFRHEEIRLAFRKAFDHNNPSIVLSEVDTFLSSYELGDEIRNLGIDVRREIATFASVFIEVAKRSRTPAEVLISNQVSSLHKKLKEIQERFDRLPTLEAVRTEIAQLVGEGYPALPGNDAVETLHVTSLQRENQRKNIALAQRMRGWFETLGYVFEKYEVWEDNYFEWIINIQGRRGYDRILVRGIEGEAGVKDVSAILASVQKQRVDEGWLVSARRISPAARNEVKKEEYDSVFCYTFDELLDQDADFSEYLNWLEVEIKRRQVDTKYVPLACIKEEIDPVTKRRLAVSKYTEDEGWIDGCIDLWLDDPVREHISILGEFGTGKTWFALHYAWVALQKYQEAKNRGIERPRLPLLIPLRDYAKAVSVESLFSEFFFRKHKMRRLHYPAFEQLNRMGKLLLIFDGFDEMAARVDRQEMINNFWELAKVVVPGAKVILTCRTEHFPEAKEGRALLNAELQASTANLTGETPQFEVLELEKFNDAQIRQVLSHQASPRAVDSVMENPELLDLARRPVMTELILEALPDIEAGKPVDMSRVYLYAVRRKMENDIKTERTFTSLADKLYFLCELSWEMLSTDQMSLNYRLFPYRIRYLFGEVVQEEKDLDHWHFDMMGQTMLIRNADGDYTPAHRSLLEFFVAYKFAAELGALANDFTEPARSKSHIYSQTPQNYTWSSYFGRDVTAPLDRFVSEPLEKLKETFGKAPLTKAVLDLLAPMVDVDIETIIKVIEGTRDKSEGEVNYVGGNAATLAVNIDSRALESRDLSNAVILNADFSNASLRHANFAGSNLKNTVFPKVFGTIFAIAISPDGKLLATGDSNCEVLIWSLQTSQVVAILQGHRDWIRSVAFSPDNKILASAGFDQTVKLWDIQTGNCLHTLLDHKSRVYCIAFSADSKVLASCDRDKVIKLWNVSNGECSKTLKGHISKVQSVTISANGKILASGSSDNTVKIWSMDTGECLRTLKGHSRTIYSVAISSDSTILASGSIDRSIKIWNLDTGECLKTLQGHTDEVRKVVFSDDNQILVSCSYDKTIKIWDFFTGECLQTLQGHTNWVRCVAVSPDSKIIISGGDDQTIRQWSTATNECVNILQGHSGGIRSVAISPDNITLASGSEEETVKLWNIGNGICQKKLKGHKSRVNSVAFSHDGKTLATGSYDRTIKLWNVDTGECLQTFFGHYGGINSLTFNPKDNIILSASGDQKAKLWDVSTGNCLKTLQGHTNWLWSIAVSPDSSIIASGGDDKTVKIWNFNTGECLHTWEGHTGSILSLARSPDNKNIASGDTDKVIKIWDINTGECLKTLQAHNNSVDSIAFSADGQILVSGSSDKTVKIWDVNTGECLKTFNGHTSRICSVAIDSNSRFIFSGSFDETIKIWDISTGECLKTLRDRPYEYMNITDVKGLSDVQKSNLKVLGAVEYGKEAYDK